MPLTKYQWNLVRMAERRKRSFPREINERRRAGRMHGWRERFERAREKAKRLPK